MRIQAELSLYPVRTLTIEKPIGQFIESLSGKGLSVVPGVMSTRVAGDLQRVFQVLSESFSDIADQHEVVLVARFSNACPNPPDEAGSRHRE